MWIYRRADRIVVVHENDKAVAVAHRIPQARVETIPHGIDTEHFAEQSRRSIPFSLPRRANHRVALYAGTIGLVHDLKTLIASVADSRIRRLPVDFCIIGDGEQVEACQELIARRGLGNVRILPALPLEWIPAVLAQADILVCSYSKGTTTVLGAKVYEYCASGKPILVHGDGAAADLVHELGNGLACKRGHPDELYRALCHFLGDWDSWHHRGQRGSVYAARSFSQAERSRRWEDLLATLTRDQNEVDDLHAEDLAV
jgi:glycosyltransferase involved in cell wall biosynthesis